MRIIFYDAESTNGTPVRHYLNLDRIDCFTVSEKDGATLLYAIMGDDVHKLNDERKIKDINLVISRLQHLCDKCSIDIKLCIDEYNADAKSVRRK